MRLSFLLILVFIGLFACESVEKKIPPVGFEIQPTIETSPVQSSGDAADDPAIWVNASRKDKSLIFASDKQAGIYAYGLDGKQKAFYPVGNINNIDVGYGYMLDSQEVDILVATNRSKNTLDIYSIDPKNGLLRAITATEIYSFAREVYGVCTYKSKEDSKMYAFITGTYGELEQWEIVNNGNGSVNAQAVRKIQMDSRCEGLVADDELGFVYVAEEDVAIWRLYAHPDSSDDYFLVSGMEGKAQLAADIEGLAIYKSGPEEGYLIASSQGNNSFAVFKRKAPYPYLGSFHIGSAEGVDEVSGTDGIAISHVNLGENFSNGIFVAQDDRNDDADGKRVNQNFKYVPWEQIGDSLGE